MWFIKGIIGFKKDKIEILGRPGFDPGIIDHKSDVTPLILLVKC
jgi:hypothetical protein